MTSLTQYFVLWLADYFLLSTLLLTLALLCCWLVKQPIRRATICKHTLSALILLAGLCALPNWSLVHLLTVESPSPAQATPQLVELPAQPVIQESPLELNSLVNPQAQAVGTPQPPIENSIAEPATSTSLHWSTVLVVLYACGCSLALSWLTIGNVFACRLIHQAQQAPTALAKALTKIIPDKQAQPDLLISNRIQAPAALGLRKPTILLPQPMADDSLETLLPVLAHECAHIQHGDLRTLALVRLLTILLWPHPLYMLLRRQIRLDQETLADATAAELTNRSDYAEQLVALAKQSATSALPRLAASVGLWESASQLRRRVAMLLDEKFTVLKSCSRRWRISSAIGLLTIAAGLSLITFAPPSTLQAEPSETELNSSKTESNDQEPTTNFIPVTSKAESENATAPQTTLPASTKAFSNGISVELLAIGTNALAENFWWDVQGHTLTKLPFAVRPKSNISPPPNGHLVFRVEDLPIGDKLRWQTIPNSSSGTGTIVIDGTENPTGYYSHLFNFPKGENTFTLRLGLATGDWKRVSTGISGAQSRFDLTAPENRRSIVFSRSLSDKHGNAVVIVSHNYKDRDCRVVAIDKEGEKHTATSTGGSSAGEQNQTQWTFATVAQEEVKEFELQTRSYEWIEFKELPSSASEDNKTQPPTEATSAVQEAQQQMSKLYKELRAETVPNSFHGICLDENHQPLQGVSIEVTWQEMDGSRKSSRPILTTTSNEKGEFQFLNMVDIPLEFPNGIPEERFLPSNAKVFYITGKKEGRVTQFDVSNYVSIANSGHSVAWIMQPAATLRGRITDQEGNPIKGVQVQAGNLGAHDINTAITDANGNYTISDLFSYDATEAQKRYQSEQAKENNNSNEQYFLLPPTIFVTAKHSKFAAKRKPIQKIPGNTDVVLGPASRIEGRLNFLKEVKTPDSFAGSRVYLQRAIPKAKRTSMALPIIFEEESTKVDETGRYQFESLPAGTYNLISNVEGWVTRGIENVEVAEGETASAPEILLTRGARVRVQLVDDNSGENMVFDKPIKGYIFPVERPQRNMPIRRSGITEFSKEGVGQIQLAPGRYCIFASLPTEQGQWTSMPIGNPQNWPTVDLLEGQVLEMDAKMRLPQEPAKATLTITSTPVSDEDEKNEE